MGSDGVKRDIVVVAHNMRSTHNVGSLLRTAEGLGVREVFLTGYTPYPKHVNDSRLPHESTKLTSQIHKTALGAEKLVPWQHSDTIEPVLISLRKNGFTIAALEQHPKSTTLANYKASKRVAIVLGREVEGLEPEVLKNCDIILEIPMYGKKESFNVVQAAAMTLYDLTFH